MNNNKIAIIANHHPILQSLLKLNGFDIVAMEVDELLNDDALCKDITGIIISNKIKVTKEIIDHFPQLTMIGRLGSGMEIVDLVYAAQKNIACFSSPEGNAQAVAEHALGMLLSFVHNIHFAQREMEQGIYERNENTGVELSSLKVGIIGYGNNGRAFAHKLAALGVRVWAYDIVPKTELDYKNITIVKNIDAVFENANCLSLHIPLNEHTHHYFNDLLIEKMQPFIFINCARGGLVNTQSLIDGIERGKILGACIDVWEYEPIQNYPADMYEQILSLIHSRKVIATPHIAGYSHQATYKMSLILAEKIINHFNTAD